MSVRTFTKVIPLSITDILVAYDEDGLLRNVIVHDPALAAAVWSLQAQQASIQQAHDLAVQGAQRIRNDAVVALDLAYQRALAGVQQTFATAAEDAAKERLASLKSVQSEIDLVTAKVFSAANQLLPPADKAVDRPATALTPSS